MRSTNGTSAEQPRTSRRMILGRPLTPAVCSTYAISPDDVFDILSLSLSRELTQTHRNNQNHNRSLYFSFSFWNNFWNSSRIVYRYPLYIGERDGERDYYFLFLFFIFLFTLIKCSYRFVTVCWFQLVVHHVPYTCHSDSYI